jgi:hypothetical protein
MHGDVRQGLREPLLSVDLTLHLARGTRPRALLLHDRQSILRQERLLDVSDGPMILFSTGLIWPL